MNDREIIRLEQFRQLKKEIRGSKEHLIVGIDVAKQNQVLVLMFLPRCLQP